MSKFKLGFSTKNYQIVYKDGQSLEDSKLLSAISDRVNRFDKYCSQYFDALNYNIWYDFKNDKFFSQAQYRFGPAGKDHVFNSSRRKFLNTIQNGIVNHDGGILVPIVTEIIDYWGFHNPKKKQEDQFFFNNEIMYGLHDKIHNPISPISDKSVLIVCGGPSANTVTWENLNYDQIWSCNQFFMNEKLLQRKVDLVTVVDNLFDFNTDPDFLKYIVKNDTVVSFEIERGDIRTSRGYSSYESVKTFCDRMRLKNNTTFFHTRYRGVIGVGPRLITYAMMAGFKDIYIVGLDGRAQQETDGNLIHAFKSNKPVPNWYRNFGDDFQDRQVILFWEYLIEIRDKYHPNTNIYNLGQDTEHNVLSRLFKHSHPLPQGIEEKLNGATY